MKKLLFLICSIALSLQASARQDTIAVYFASGKATLTQGIQQQLADHIYNDVLEQQQTLQIIGYADYVGKDKYNDRLSKARASAVKSFLKGYGFEDNKIIICVGKGEVPREGMSGNAGFTRDRRVDIVIGPPAATEAPVAAPPAAQPEKVSMPMPVTTVQDLGKMKPNETIVLSNIYFYPGRHAIRPESAPALEQLFQQLKRNTSVRLSIEGHVCCVKNGIPDALDDDTHEIALSVNRAKAIYAFLVKKGIDKNRLEYRGFGATHRVSEEHTEEEADKNRRVELRIL